MSAGASVSEEEQKRMGQAQGGDMDEQHKEFVKLLAQLIADGTIDPTLTETFVKKEVYHSLSPDMKVKVDLSIPNIATLLTHIVEFYVSKQTPDACPQLANMIEQLWVMKERIEKDVDVFVF